MDQEQREFAVKKIERYNEQIDKLKKENIITTIVVGITGAAAVLATAAVSVGHSEYLAPLAGFTAFFAGYNTNILMKNIAKKTGLEMERSIIDLENQFEMDKLDQGRGR